MTLFDYAELAVGVLIVIAAVKPMVTKARVGVFQARQGVQEVLRRKHALSQQIRALARESLHHGLARKHDGDDSEGLHEVIEGLTRRVGDLEAVDRRVLVLDERRGQRETGWIVHLCRDEDAPPMEPERVTETWRDGRYVFFWAPDERGARQRAGIRFPEAQGFRILDVAPHTGDLTEPPALTSAGSAGRTPALPPSFDEG